MLFKKETPAPAPQAVGAPANADVPVPANDAEASAKANPFAEAAEALIALQDEGKLPEGFDLEAACGDAAFASLLQEFGAPAAVRIYDAEQKAARAYEDAMAAMTEKLRVRNALPKPTKPNRAVSANPDYMALSASEFRALENRIKSAARSGKRITL